MNNITKETIQKQMEKSLYKKKKEFKVRLKLFYLEIKQKIYAINKETILNYFKSLSQPTVAIISVVLILIIAAIDHITVYDFGFYVLYYIPLIFFSWYSNKLGATLISIFTINVLYIANFHQSYQFTITFSNIWNLTLMLASFLLVSLGAQHVSHLLKAEKELTSKLKRAISEIKKLSGLLPICVSCKKIRNDKGYWEQIELYFSHHSEVSFTHGLCPECMEKQYESLRKKGNIQNPKS